MGGLSIWHWLIVILVIVLLFGRGKISDLMGDVAKGVKSFKKGLLPMLGVMLVVSWLLTSHTRRIGRAPCQSCPRAASARWIAWWVNSQ